MMIGEFEKMRKYMLIALVSVLMLGGCSISWLNPFSNDKTENQKEEVAKFVPNPFLWQAALDKLSFMPLEKEEIDNGLLETKWSKVRGISNEEFKIKVQVLAWSLRSDCLKVEVKKRLRSGNQWQEAETDSRLAQEIEVAILNQSRILYRKSLANKED